MNRPSLPVAFLILVCLATTAMAGSSNVVGRFMLTTSSMRLPDGTEESLLIKIDTATGETWKYTQMQLPIAQKYDKTPILGPAVGWLPMQNLHDSAGWKFHTKFLARPTASNEVSRVNTEHISHMVAWARKHLSTGGEYVGLDGSTNTFTALQTAQILRTYSPTP
jgi:hypothetical protein